MEGLKVAVPVAPNLMGSEGFLGARVCGNDGEAGESGDKVDECSSFSNHGGTPNSSESPSWIKKTDMKLYRSNSLLSRFAREELLQGLPTTGSVAVISGFDATQIHQKVEKVPKNGIGSFKRLRTLPMDSLSSQAEADVTKVEPDKLGLHLVKCSNADKSQAVRTKSSINGRRADRKNSKVAVKTKYDPFCLRAGPSISPANGGSNVFGMYGLKPDVHDVTKLLDDISLDELLDGSYKYPTLNKDKGKKASNVNENILDSVRKTCSILQLRGSHGKQTEEVDTQVSKKNPSLSPPSNTSATNSSDGDESSLAAGLSASNDQESCMKDESPARVNDGSLQKPRDILERLALPPSKDLDSLLQESVKSAASVKHTDSRAGKPLSHRVSLPPFSWSHNFIGHYKSNGDAVKLSNRSTCQGRWVRIRSTASFIGGGSTEGFMDLESLTYDDSLVPAGQLKYRLPEVAKTSATHSQHYSQQESSSTVFPPASLPPSESASTPDSRVNALDSPRALTAAQMLCDIASHWTKHNSNGILKWPKQQPSLKVMKARKSRSSDRPDDEFLAPKPEALLENGVRVAEYRSSSKKPKLSSLERRDDFSHVQAVIGLSSVSAPRSSRTSPSRLPRDSVTEARYYSSSIAKPPFMFPPPPRVVDRNNHNPQKPRKTTPMDWNRTRS